MHTVFRLLFFNFATQVRHFRFLTLKETANHTCNVTQSEEIILKRVHLGIPYLACRGGGAPMQKFSFPFPLCRPKLLALKTALVDELCLVIQHPWCNEGRCFQPWASVSFASLVTEMGRASLLGVTLPSNPCLFQLEKKRPQHRPCRTNTECVGM